MTQRITTAMLARALESANTALGLTDPDGPHLTLYSAYGGHRIDMTGGPYLRTGHTTIGVGGCQPTRAVYEQLSAIAAAARAASDPTYRTA